MPKPELSDGFYQGASRILAMELDKPVSTRRQQVQQLVKQGETVLGHDVLEHQDRVEEIDRTPKGDPLGIDPPLHDQQLRVLDLAGGQMSRRPAKHGRRSVQANRSVRSLGQRHQVAADPTPEIEANPRLEPWVELVSNDREDVVDVELARIPELLLGARRECAVPEFLA